MSRTSQQKLRHRRIRKKVTGTTERPRLCINISGKHIRAQVIDDSTGSTLVSVQTTEKDLSGEASTKANSATAEKVGNLVAERSKSKNIEKVVFDRGGRLYHGRVKALAEAARAGGLQF